MSADARALTDLAASVADGAPINWDEIQSTAGPEQQRLVRHLHLVSGVAELYRSLPLIAHDSMALGEEPQGPRWGPLVILGSLGKGTTAEVHRAWDVALQREVALKLFPPDDGDQHAHERVLSEARRLARVRHPNVAAVYGAERHGDRVGFWMELVDGASLDQILEQQGPFSAHEAALIGSEIASALASVHKAGLLHRDVKAQNVLREDGGRIVLTDFGTGEEVNAQGPTRLAGTPMYLAPEILRGKPASIQSDIYSLGVLLFLLTTRSFPIDAKTMVDLARGHAEGRRRALRDARPDLPPALTNVIEKAIAESPSERFASAGAFEEALRRTLDPASASPFPPEGTPVARASQHAFLYFAVVALMVFALTLPAWKGKSTTVRGGAAVASLAVLPLMDTTGHNPQLADGMTEQLIATLGRLGALQVTSSASVQAFRGREIPPAEIARQLGVDAVLQGQIAESVTSPGSPRRVQISARLLSAGSGSELWSGRFAPALGDVTAVETEIARSIARGIRLVVTPREADRLRTGGRTSPQAEEAYFQGRYHLSQFGVDSARRALTAFRRAVDLDPEYAAAYAALARTYVTLGFIGAIPQAEARQRALAAADRASALDPELSDAQAAVGDLKFYYDWDWQGADAAYRRAIDLTPSNAYARSQYARFLAAAGKSHDAVTQARTAEQLDPLSPAAAQTTGLVLYYARDYAAAASQLLHALEIDPTFSRVHAVLARVREAQGQFDEALREIDTAIEGAQQAAPSWFAYRARVLALRGDREGANAIVEDLRHGPLRVPPESLAYVYLALRDDQRALGLLEQATRERDPAMLWLKVDPRVDRLRSSQRLTMLVERLNQR
ncbi:MAG: protein kinase domain-containing protein [Acidobacteriota bacterium]